MFVGVMAAGCSLRKAEPVFPQVWATGPSDRVGAMEPPRDETSCYSLSENLIRLVGAVNETIGFECVLSAIGRPAAAVEIDVDDFVAATATIPKQSVRLYRHWPVTIERFPNWFLRTQGLREPRSFPDVLVPLDGGGGGPGLAAEPQAVVGGTNLTIYIEVRVPKDALPETYRSSVVLKDSLGHERRTAIELVVRDVFLSPEDAIPIPARVQLSPLIAALTDLDPRNIQAALTDDRARQEIARVFALLHDHGLSPYTDEVRPRVSLGASGEIVLDWDLYDDFCGPLIDGTAYEDKRPAQAWPMPIDIHQPDPAQYEGVSSPAYAAALQDYVSQVRSHFDSMGWMAKSFIDFDFPDTFNPSSAEYEQFRKLVATARGIDPKMAILSRLIPQPMGPFGWFEHRHEDLDGEVDIWSTPARYEHAATLARLRGRGARTWFSPDRPPFSGSLAVEAPLVQARSLPWQAFLRGQEAIAISRATDWPAAAFDEPIRDRSVPSDAWLAYPGKPFGADGPLPSVRLKQLQAGIQEYQYLRLLDRNGRGETARLLAGSLIQSCGTDAYGDNFQDGVPGRRVDDPEIWEQARSLLSQETAIALSEGRDDAVDRSVNLTGWARFLGATRWLEMWVESARVAVDPLSRPPRYIVTFEVAVQSSLRTSVEGSLSFVGLPPGAKAIGGPAQVGPLEEWELVKRSIAFETTELPIRDLDGHFSQTIAFDGGTSGQVAVEAVASIVQPMAAAGPIMMDGQLNDWGPGEFNIAGDFRLVGGQPAAGRRRAERQTVAYFCRAGDMLYIGIRAAAGGEAVATTATRRNIVEYEDLMPIDEDLVEIILDPSGTGTLSEDLYHIVIKSTGDPVFERGVGVSPPIGKVAAWDGRRPDYAVSVSEDGWTAEIAIPLSALGPQASRNRVWGMNLARLEPQRGEYSDWARVPRYCYDARSLGNLVWPD